MDRPRSVERLFDRVAEKYDRYATTGVARRIQRILTGSVRSRLSPPARLLDVGCGPGHHALTLARLGYDVTGLDVSDRMLSVLRERGRAERVEVDTVKVDILRDDIPGGPYHGAIAAMGPMNYTPDPSVIVRRIRRALHGDGFLWIVAARGASLLEPRRMLWPLLARRPLHQVASVDGERLDLYLWDPVTFSRVLEPWFEVIDIRSTGILPRAPDRVDMHLGRQPLLRRLGAASFITARAR